MSTANSAEFNPAPRDGRLAALLRDFPQCDLRLHLSTELLDRYSVDLAIDVLRNLGVVELLDEWRTADEIIRLKGFQRKFEPPLIWLLDRLSEFDLLVRNRMGEFRAAKALPAQRLDELRKIGLEIDPANEASLAVMTHAASVYPAFARGEANGEQAFFGPAAIDLWLNYFCSANPSYAINNAIAAKAVADRFDGKTILEIGAGAGSASEALLAALRERGVEPLLYVVTEPSAFLRRRAERILKRGFPDFPLQFAALDMDRPWALQGAAVRAFDVVFAVNVFHVAKDLVFTLRQARETLAPNGWLVIGESFRPQSGRRMYPELVFQIFDGYNQVALDPEFRPNPGFLTTAQWRSAFRRAGFDSFELVPEVERIQALYSNFLTGAACAQSPR